MTHPTSFSTSQLQSTADDALASVEAAGDHALALVQTWITQGNASAVQEVAEHGSGDVRKAARRGINVLKSKGVPIPPRKKQVQPLALQRPQQAWLFAPDTTGTLAVIFTERLPDLAYRASFVYLQDGIGVLKVETGSMSHSRLQQSLKKTAAGQGYEPVSVAIPWARQLVRQARDAQRANGLLEPLGFKGAESLLEPVPSEPQTHPFDEEGFELAAEDALSLAQKSGALHALPEFRSWTPSREAVSELLAKVGEHLTAGEQPEEEALSRYVQEESLAATDRYFTPEVRQRLLRNLKHSAISIVAREGETRGLELAATLTAIEQAGLITNPPRQVPFLTAFFDKAIALLLAQGQGKLRIPVRSAPQEGSLDAPAP